MASRDWPNLAQHAKDRREELGLTQETVAASGGPSTATLRLIENTGAKSYRAKSLAQLEAALKWRPGSVRRVLAGGDPETIDEPSYGPLAELLRAARLRLAAPDGREHLRKRPTFATERGIDYQLVHDLEQGTRTSLAPDEAEAVADAYEVPAASLEPFLVSPARAYIRESALVMDDVQAEFIAGVIRVTLNPPAPAAEQEHRRAS